MQKPPSLTARELTALLALKKISDGQVTFLNVLDADMLVRKGLAERFGKGQFVLTERGLELTKMMDL